MSKKFMAVMKAAVPVMIGFGALVLLARWGDDNDVPVLQDIYDVIS